MIMFNTVTVPNHGEIIIYSLIQTEVKIWLFHE